MLKSSLKEMDNTFFVPVNVPGKKMFLSQL